MNQRFEDHFGHHLTLLMMMTEMVFETLVRYGYLARLIAREDYIKFSRRESSKTYIIIPVLKYTRLI
jgi:hypothetical protein